MNVKSTDPEYEVIIGPKRNTEPACDVKMDVNPAYQATT